MATTTKLTLLAMLVLALILPLRADIIPAVADAHTVILDHFDGSTVGNAFGPLNFQPSQPGLDQAGVFGPGNFVQYAFTPWCSGCLGSNPANQGTLEFWVKMDTIQSFFDMNWNYTLSPPPAGHILYAAGPNFWDGSNDAFFQTWNWERGILPDHIQGTTALPTGEWVYIAYSWSPDDSKLYVNGVLQTVIYANVYPALGGGQNYIYLNNWGNTDFHGAFDEFQLSNIQRTDEEIAARFRAVPEPGSMLLLGSGLLGLAGLLRRKLNG